MKQPIRPATLKTLRERRGLSQANLAARSEEMHQKVGIATIKRIEAWDGTDTYMASPTVAERLSKVLGVAVEDLGNEPTADELDRKRELRKLGLRQLRAAVNENTSLAFRMVEHLYDIPIRAQIEMAPLCMALLAEGSLAWREKRLDEISQKADELMSLGGGNFSFAHAVYRTQEAACDEEESIRKRDVFGRDVAPDTYDLGYDPNTNNPFADYLRELSLKLRQPGRVLVDHDSLEPSGFPDFWIGHQLVKEITGSDPDAEYALACGHVRLSDTPDDLLGEEQTEKRIEWIVSHIPEDELADRKEARAKLDKLLAGLDLGDLLGNSGDQGGQSE